MTDWIFDAPFWLPIAIVVLGAIIWFSGNKRVDKTLKRLGLIAMVLGVSLAIVSYVVDTDKEKAISGTRQLVRSVSDRDWTNFQAVLHPKVQFMFYRNRDALVAGAKTTADSIGLKWVRLTGLEATQDPAGIVTNIAVFSEQDGTGGQMIRTNWQFDWQEGSEGWQVVKITYLPESGLTPDQIEKRLAR